VSHDERDRRAACRFLEDIMTLWILIADEGRARLFAMKTEDRKLEETEGFIHSKSRLRSGQILTDRPGRVGPPAGGHRMASVQPHTDPKTVEIERFAVELAAALHDARAKSSYDLLALVAPPRFLGMLRGRLSTEVSRVLVGCLDKELTTVDVRELPRYLTDVVRSAALAELAAESRRLP
jgi:protein required for attachment to host cells